jgi:hypothetical protein
MQQLVYARVETLGEQAGVSSEVINQTVLGDVAKAPIFLDLLRRVYELGLGQPVPRQPIFSLMRCLKGKSGLKHSLIFHYDSYHLTALLPIVIPEGAASGHLLMVPNTRRFRSSYLHNLWDKLLLDNPMSQKRLARAFHAKQLAEVVMQPGSLYLFWGYRTIHANAPCDPEKIRATALFHLGDPYEENRLRRMIRRAKSAASGLAVQLKGA